MLAVIFAVSCVLSKVWACDNTPGYSHQQLLTILLLLSAPILFVVHLHMNVFPRCLLLLVLVFLSRHLEKKRKTSLSKYFIRYGVWNIYFFLCFFFSSLSFFVPIVKSFFFLYAIIILIYIF